MIRRIGSLVAGVEDVHYKVDPFTNDKANLDNLIGLLAFSRDLLIEYDNMPLYQIENIDAYNKIDLFKRFALDAYSSIYLLKKRSIHLTELVERFYDELIEEFDETILKNRISDVRNRKISINSLPYYT